MASGHGSPVRAIDASTARWAIDVYAGPSPLALSPRDGGGGGGGGKPAISRADISDVPAQFVADPFMIRSDGRWHMFFEVMNCATDRGEIGLAVSSDAVRWEYRGRVLVEPFHLSYPHVFKWRDDYYMTPETLALQSVSLYRATRFPTHWKRIASLVSARAADPTIFEAGGMLWLMACSPARNSETLRLYGSTSLFGTWTEHPASPLVAADASRARPGGRVISHAGRMIRFAQDCSAVYGERVRAFEIRELRPGSYREVEIPCSPALGPSGSGWNARGMHHVDAHELPDGGWIACVDGC